MKPLPGSKADQTSDNPTRHLILQGDGRSMDDISDSAVQLIVTSPPYWQLKDYSAENQIGYNDTYEEYINNLNLVWDESFRVLSPGCRLCINIGDQFARAAYYGRYKVIPIRTEIIRFCEIKGFDYMGAIIWQKPTTMNTSGGGSVMGSYPFPRNGIIKIDYEFILVFKKPGKCPPPTKDVKQASVLSKQQWNDYFKGHWIFPGERQDGHIARFPVELPRRLIQMFSFIGETVLDPFLGSGTTSVAAIEQKRNSCGYEINKQYIKIIQNRLSSVPHRSDLVFEQAISARIEPESRIKTLPCRYSGGDELKLKIDPRKNSFGSVISSGSNQEQTREHLVSIAEITNFDKITLSDGVTVKLIGVVAIQDQQEAAVQFLKDRTRGKRVFIRAEKEGFGSGKKPMPVYLFLKNKTHLNAHLIKHKLAVADRKSTYKFKNRFISYEKEAYGSS